MNFTYYNQFSSFSDFNYDEFQSEMRGFRSLNGRLYCFKAFLQKILFLPFAILFKAIMTFFRAIGLLLSIALVIGSFGASIGAREFFFRRVLFFSRDLAEWVLFPLIIILDLFRLLLGCTLHPAVYFR